MSRIPFSRSDVDDLVSGSHIFKKRFSLNNRLRARLPKSRVKYLFGIVVVVLFLFGSQLTACGYSTVSPTGSGSPTSNTTSIPNTPGSRSGPGSTSASTSTAVPTTHPTVIPTTNPTAGPTTHPTAVPTTNPTAEPTTDPTAGPTTDPTAVPTAPPSSFTVSQMNLDFTCSAAGQCNPSPQPIEIDNNNKSIPILPINWSVQVTWDPTNSPPQPANDLLSVHPSSGTLDKPSDQVNIKASNSKAHLPPGSYIANLVWCPPNKDDPNHIVTVTLTVVSSAPSVSGISPPMGSASTSVTITGSGFTGATSVSFGPTASSSFTVNSDTKITATSPAGSGTVDVTVTTPNGTSATSAADQFTYILTPTVVPSPTPTNTPTPTPTTAPSPTPTDTPTPVPPTPTPTDTPTPIPSNTPTPTSIPSMTAHNRFLFGY